jgi:hypothetical protein
LPDRYRYLGSRRPHAREGTHVPAAHQSKFRVFGVGFAGEAPTTEAATKKIERAFFGALLLWLAAAALLVDVEPYDGWDAICNGRFFSGLPAPFTLNRWPLLGFLLAPAGAISERLALSPLDVRPAHFETALLHGIYLVCAYGMLRRFRGATAATLIAFAAAVPTFVFFSYAPFVSHDIFPGALFLAMLLLSERLARSFSWRDWGLLAALGSAALLVKPSYAACWGALLLARALPSALRLPRPLRTPGRSLGWIASAAAASALAFWIVMALFLARFPAYAGMGFWIRPYRQIALVSAQYGDAARLFPWWLYLRNFPAGYGFLASVLLVPGIVLSARKSRLAFMIAAAWCAAFLAMQVTPLREVRYLAFLAPLTACVIAPAVERVLAKRALLLVAAPLLVLDAVGAAREAGLVLTPFYRHAEARTLLEPMTAVPGFRSRPLVFNEPMLSFVSPARTPLAGDRYHRLFHLGMNHVAVLHGLDFGNLHAVDAQGATADSFRSDAPAGSLVVLSSRWVGREPGSWLRPARTPFACEQSLSLVEEGSRLRVLSRLRREGSF